MIAQGEVWWADLPAPEGSAPGFRRPVVVVQGDAFNRSALRTALCVPLTSNLRWAEAPGNVLLTARSTGLPRDSVANVSQLVTLDTRDMATDGRATRAGYPSIPMTTAATVAERLFGATAGHLIQPSTT